MKIKEYKIIKTKEIKEIKKIVSAKRQDLKKAHLAKISGKEKNLKLNKNLKKDIVQLLTLISQKERMK